MLQSDIKEFLDREAARINSVDFISRDPVQFPRQFSTLPDVEVVAWLCASIAWGNRTMICRNCRKMLDIMEHDPRNYVLSGDWQSLPDELNIHRTFFARDFKYAMRGFREIFTKWHSLNDFAAAHHVADHPTPAWRLVELMQALFREANGGAANSRFMPLNLEATALKRVNMALRWLVRNDDIVDLGLWTAITPDKLFIPLDVHVGDVARALQLITRRANDKRTVLQLTEILRQMRPHDPVYYDYALFGIGVDGLL